MIAKAPSDVWNPLLHRDADFDAIARISDLKLFK